MLDYYVRLVGDHCGGRPASSRLLFIATLGLAVLGGVGVPALPIPSAAQPITALPLLALVTWELLATNYGRVRRANSERELAQKEQDIARAALAAKPEPDIRVGFVPDDPQALVHEIASAPGWKSEPWSDPWSTELQYRIRVYNNGSGTARGVRITYVFPPGLLIRMAPGMPSDEVEQILQIDEPETVVQEVRGLNQGEQHDTRVHLRVRHGLPRHSIGYSITLEDHHAVSGELVIAVAQ